MMQIIVNFCKEGWAHRANFKRRAYVALKPTPDVDLFGFVKM
jgi:hypothetical protein